MGHGIGKTASCLLEGGPYFCFQALFVGFGEPYCPFSVSYQIKLRGFAYSYEKINDIGTPR